MVCNLQKVLTVDSKLSDKSLIETNKKISLMMDPYDASVLTGYHPDM